MKRRKPMATGDTYNSKSHGVVTVLEVYPNDKALIEFEDGTQGVYHRTAIVKGFVKNYMEPIVLGRGFMGIPRISKCRAYGVWKQMLTRCYSGELPAYKDCTVCDDWLNFSKFKLWYEDQDGCNDLGYQLDKDILCRRNKEYCPEKCCLIPSGLNKLLENSRAARGRFPLGVSLNSAAMSYTARCCDAEGGYIHLGMYDTPDSAFLAYKTFKEDVIKREANKYKDVLKAAVYASLMLWEIMEDD